MEHHQKDSQTIKSHIHKLQNIQKGRTKLTDLISQQTTFSKFSIDHQPYPNPKLNHLSYKPYPNNIPSNNLQTNVHNNNCSKLESSLQKICQPKIQVLIQNQKTRPKYRLNKNAREFTNYSNLEAVQEENFNNSDSDNSQKQKIKKIWNQFDTPANNYHNNLSYNISSQPSYIQDCFQTITQHQQYGYLNNNNIQNECNEIARNNLSNCTFLSINNNTSSNSIQQNNSNSRSFFENFDTSGSKLGSARSHHEQRNMNQSMQVNGNKLATTTKFQKKQKTFYVNQIQYKNENEYFMNQSYTYKSYKQTVLNNSQNRKNNQIDNDDPLYQIDLENIIEDNRTTLMIKNIPNKYSQDTLIQEINNKGHQERYDFFYVPIDLSTNLNKGYAFINFEDSRHIHQFYQDFEGRRWNSGKVCQIKYGSIQGIQNIIKHFMSASIMKDPLNKPYIKYDGINGKRNQKLVQNVNQNIQSQLKN